MTRDMDVERWPRMAAHMVAFLAGFMMAVVATILGRPDDEWCSGVGGSGTLSFLGSGVARSGSRGRF